MTHSRHLVLGSLVMVLAMLCFALSGVFMKLIGDQASISVALFFRFFCGLVLLLPFFLKDHQTFVNASRLNRIIIRGLVGLSALACMFYAIKYMTLANALLLNNTATLFIPLIVWLARGVKTSFKIIFTVLIGFVGVVFVLGPDKSLISTISLIGLASGVLGAIDLVMVRDLAQTRHPFQIVFYYCLVGTVATMFFFIFQVRFYPMIIWIYLCGVGVFGGLFQIFLAYALKMANVRYVSSLSFLSFVFAGFFDWLLWSRVPSIRIVFGMVLVIVGGFLTIYFGGKEQGNKEIAKR